MPKEYVDGEDDACIKCLVCGKQYVSISKINDWINFVLDVSAPRDTFISELMLSVYYIH